MTPSEILQTIENELLANIAKNLGGDAVGTATWQIKKLADLGRLNSQNQAIIKKYIKGLDAAITAEITEEIEKYAGQLDIMFESAINAGASLSSVLPINADATLREIIAIAERSASSLPNLLANSMLSGADSVYSDIINVATVQTLGGITTGEQAITSTLRQWAGKGLPGLTDSAGRSWTPEAYVRMELQTAKTNAYTDLCLARSEEYGSDLIEVDSHAGARPGCAPYQGRVYSLSGNDPDYPALSDTSYGEASGLFGVNCGHNMYPFFKGISQQTYSQYNDAENAEAYKQSQRQRLLERRIRDAKREVSTLEAGGFDTTEAKALVRQRQATMRDFIDESGRTRRYAREQIVT